MHVCLHSLSVSVSGLFSFCPVTSGPTLSSQKRADSHLARGLVYKFPPPLLWICLFSQTRRPNPQEFRGPGGVHKLVHGQSVNGPLLGMMRWEDSRSCVHDCLSCLHPSSASARAVQIEDLRVEGEEVGSQQLWRDPNSTAESMSGCCDESSLEDGIANVLLC